MINFRNTLFNRSCPSYKNLPEDSLVEIAFAGRSNVGKSSVINSLTGKKKN
jgi:GTP-binding protein